MNPRCVTPKSRESGVVGSKTNDDQPGAASCEAVTSPETSPAQVTPQGDEPDTSAKCLTAERAASETEQMAAWPLTLDQIIKQALIRSLRETGGNRRRTATQLGISRSTLYRMLARYGIDQIGRDSASR
jgi:DNA-binding NtrC family response regulator